MSFSVHIKPASNSTEVSITEHYRDAKGQLRARVVSQPEYATGTSPEESPATPVADAPPRGAPRPPRLLAPTEDPIAAICAERQNPNPYHEMFPEAQSVDADIFQFINLGSVEVFGALLDRSGIANLFSRKFAESRLQFQAEVIRQIMHRDRWNRTTGYFGVSPAIEPAGREKIRMRKQLKAERIDRLRELTTAAVTDLLGTAPTEAALLVSTKNCTWEREDDWRDRQLDQSLPPPPLQSRFELAVLMTPEGLPLDFWATPEPAIGRSALPSILDDIQQRHSDLRIAVVTNPNSLEPDDARCVAAAGYSHIAPAELHELPPEMIARLSDLDSYTPPHAEGNRTLDLTHDGRRLIAFHTDARAKTDARKREKKFAAAERMLETGEIRDNPYLTVELLTPARLRPDLYELDASLDGVRGIWTDLQHHPAHDLHHRYTECQRLGDQFELIPFEDAETPESYWTETQTNAHAALSFCAFTLMRMLRHCIARHGELSEPMSERTMLQEVSRVNGTVLYSMESGHLFLMPDRPTETQRSIYRAMGLRLPETAQPLSFVPPS